MLFLAIVAIFAFYGIGYAVAYVKCDGKRPKLTRYQLKSILRDYEDLDGIVDIEAAAERIEFLLQPENYHLREGIKCKK